MANARNHLSRILISIAKLQEQSDFVLDSIKDGLIRIGDSLDEALEYIGVDED